MKKLFYLLPAMVLVTLSQHAFAQNINWKNLRPSQKHMVHLNLGFDNATTIGLGYGYQLKTKMPVVLTAAYSMPFGEKPFDDLKTKLGAQVNLIRSNYFCATVSALGVIRRYENDYVTMLNFGSEFSATAGIYKPKWFAAADFGFDKAIITHLQHSGLMKEYNPGVESGWYIPNGGNFNYGVQAGYSINRNDVYAKIGKTIAEDLKTTAMLPFYFQVGLTRRF